MSLARRGEAGEGGEFWREKQFGVGEPNFTFSQNSQILIGFLVEAVAMLGFNWAIANFSCFSSICELC